MELVAGGEEGRKLEETPTWAVATVCTIYVVASLFCERGIHYLGKWLTKTKRKPLYEALEKVKEELMLLGFISLLLTVTADYVSRVCVTTSFYDKQPTTCRKNDSSAGNQRKLGEYVLAGPFRRSLVTAGYCPKIEGKEPFISYSSLEQLHRFIFVMAITHILYSCMTILLAIVKVHGWRNWEEEAHSNADNMLAEITRNLTLKRQSTFVMYHTSAPWSRNRFIVWMVCFFRQFGQSVTKADYLALRMGFIKNHRMAENFDFHGYMIRSMEDEFQEVVGVSYSLWIFVVAFMLFNIDGLNLYLWLASVPIILILLVGAKLQHVIATLALENAGIKGRFGIHHLQPRDELFWFNRPQLLLWLIHFILFQNAFELATFFWSWWQFGYQSCLIRRHFQVYLRLLSGLVVQFFCSYSTLPLYSLVTQMGSRYKRAIFNEDILESLHGWRQKARRHAKLGKVQQGSTRAPPEDSLEGFGTLHDHEVRPQDVKALNEIEVELEDVEAYSDHSFRQQSIPILRPTSLPRTVNDGKYITSKSDEK